MDSSFANAGVYTGSYPTPTSTHDNLTTLLVLPDGRIFVAGVSGRRVFQADGSVDTSFNDPLGRMGSIASGAISPLGYLLLNYNREFFKLSL